MHRPLAVYAFLNQRITAIDMTFNEIAYVFVQAGICDTTRFHWFTWHFRSMHPLAIDIIQTLKMLDARMPGFAQRTALKIASLGGRDKFEPHYEQLIQILCELVIARRFCEKFPESEGFKIKSEPTELSAKNPELEICGSDFRLLVEVKCPSLLSHMRASSSNNVQLTTRLGDPNIFDQMSKSGKAIRPLDNRIKDYLISADQKFSSFDLTALNTYSLLVIGWNQKMFEPVSSLINPGSGLLTDNSFCRDTKGALVQFSSVDGIVITQHMDSLMAATRDEIVLGHYSTPLDYGTYGPPEPVPNPVFIANPNSMKKIPAAIVCALEAQASGALSDPIASPLDLIFWL